MYLIVLLEDFCVVRIDGTDMSVVQAGHLAVEKARCSNDRSSNQSASDKPQCPTTPNFRLSSSHSNNTNTTASSIVFCKHLLLDDIQILTAPDYYWY